MAHHKIMAAQGYPRSRFLQEDFDARLFVNSQVYAGEEDDATTTSLDLVVENLKATVQDLTDQLLALIDRDHQTFLELSGDLVRVDSTVGTLRGPLANLKQKVDQVKRITASPQQICEKYDAELASLQQKKRALQQRMYSRECRRSVETYLTNAQVHRAAQRIALLARVDSTNVLDLKHRVEVLLLDGIFTLTDTGELGRRLCSLVMMNGLEPTRRKLLSMQSTHTLGGGDEDALLNQFAPLLRATAKQNLGTVFEFPKDMVQLCKAAKPVITTAQEYRALEHTRQRLAMLSPTQTPHAAVHWNPRVHCELKFQDASEVLRNSDQPTLVTLQTALRMLREDGDMQDVLLQTHLFRTSVKLVAGWLHHLEESTSQDNEDALARAKDLFEFKRLVMHENLLQGLQHEAASNVVEKLARQAARLGLSCVTRVKQTCIEACIRELNAHERSVTGKYRMSGRELDYQESTTASKVLAPLFDTLQELLPVQELDKRVLHGFAEDVVQEVLKQYLAVVDVVVRRETSLLKLHQSRNASGVMTDSHKICKQLGMDASRFVKDVKMVFESKLGDDQAAKRWVDECEAVVQALNAF